MTVADEDTTTVLPLLCIPHRVLFPGETLPMHIYNPHVSEEGRKRGGVVSFVQLKIITNSLPSKTHARLCVNGCGLLLSFVRPLQ